MKKIVCFVVLALAAFAVHSQPEYVGKKVETRYLLVDMLTNTYERILYTTYVESVIVGVEDCGYLCAKISLENGVVLDVLSECISPCECMQPGCVWGYKEYVCETVTDTTYVLLEVKTVSERNKVLWQKRNLLYVNPETFYRVVEKGLLDL